MGLQLGHLAKPKQASMKALQSATPKPLLFLSPFLAVHRRVLKCSRTVARLDVVPGELSLGPPVPGRSLPQIYFQPDERQIAPA